MPSTSPVTSDPVREPLFQKATVVTIVGSVVALLAAFGVHVRPELADAAIQLGTIALLLLPIVTAWVARRHVTPIADPRAADGTPLVPASTPSNVDGDAAP
jgi:hypothetical protein